MKKICTLLLIGFFAIMAGMTTGAAAGGISGAIQAGIGTANTTGDVEFGLNYQVFTLEAAGMLFPNEWLAVIADISYGLPHEYAYASSGDVIKIETKAAFADGMLGVYKTFADGGFIYAATGVAVGWGSLELKDSDPATAYDIESGIGLVIGAGVALPIADNFMGVVTMRQRYITSEIMLEQDGSRKADFSIGGLDMGIGLAYYFGK